MFAPVALCVVRPLSVPPEGWACVVGTGIFYAAYFWLIARSYERDDLSRAYTIARGVAPAATAAWGVLFHHEHPSVAGWLGIAAISAGVFTLAGSGSRRGAGQLSPGPDGAPLRAGLLRGPAPVDLRAV